MMNCNDSFIIRRQAIDDDFSSITTHWTDFNDNIIKTNQFSLLKLNFKLSSTVDRLMTPFYWLFVQSVF